MGLVIFVTGHAFGYSYPISESDYPFVVAGENDDPASVQKVTGDNTLERLAKYDWDEDTKKWKRTEGSYAFDVTPADKTGSSGTWSSSDPSAYVWYVTVKAGNGYAIYKIDPATSGVWTTILLGEKDLSHICVFR